MTLANAPRRSRRGQQARKHKAPRVIRQQLTPRTTNGASMTVATRPTGRGAQQSIPTGLRRGAGRRQARRTSFFVAPLPWYAYAGLALNLASWYSSWAKVGPWAYTFFPIWFGFILVLDGLNVARTGTSPLKRSLGRFALLFVLSSPFWWVFEALNQPAQNWNYHLDHHYTPFAYGLITSIDYSTVLPAVLELVELLAGFAALRPRLNPRDMGGRLPFWAVVTLVAVGAGCILATVYFPLYAFPLIWLCLVFLLDPINNLFGRKSAFGHLLAGDWRFIVTVPLATLICGFFWEMWNSHANPYWFYIIPYINRPPYLFGGPAPHLFQMPLVGYLGYLPFGIELFAMYQLALLILQQRQRDDILVV
ncbi:MAG: hypothetical protein ABI068_16010 [Ktedonobacterales bacterium]